MNKEKILSELLQQRKGEEENFAYKKAIARADVEVPGVPYNVFWLYNDEFDSSIGNYKKQRYVCDPVHSKGIAKNSKLGEVIIQRQDGTYKTEKGVFNVSLKSLTTYTPIQSNFDAVNGSIEIKGKRPFLFRSAFALMNIVDEPVGESQKLSILQLINDQLEADVLGKELSFAEKEQSRILYETTRYILENNELRQQPILDPTQEEIKRSRIFNGTVVINGGPGTGKTTILIQRIKFLIDPTISEYWIHGEKLLSELQGNNGWIFFSPNQLLLGFLQNAMVDEGLKASSNRSKVWSTFLNSELLITYELIGPGRGFQLYRQPIATLLNNEPKTLKSLLLDFEEFLLKQLSDRIEKCCQVKIEDAQLRKKSALLIANASSLIKADNIVRFIQMADDLAERFSQSFKSQVDQINEQLQKFTDIVFVRLKRDEEKFKLVSTHLKELFEKNNEFEDDEEMDMDDSSFDVKIPYYNESLVIRKYIKSWLRKYFLVQADKDEVISKKQDEWIKIISKFCDELPLHEFGNKLLYVKNISPLVAGSSTIFFKKIPAFYKLFRKTLPNWFGKHKMDYSAQIMSSILTKGEARLHYDERCFLILSINSIIRQLQKNNATVFIKGDNSLIAAYKRHQRYIVAIDEASDFSLIELACMQSFSYPLYNCTTLSGDLMQRMTKSGIEDWKNILDFTEEGEIKNLQMSYRQSPTLLNLAKIFYQNVTKRKANYTSYTSISLYEPKPVIKCLGKFEQKIKWIAENILVIYKTYGNKIPSIAIFVPGIEEVFKITNELKSCDTLADLGIDVQPVSEEGGIVQKGKIGIYNIENIKGLEFEAVFFIDIDLIHNADDALLQKYVYVGLSRAAYYLFVSFEKSLPTGLEFLSAYMEPGASDK